ncbi:MAG: hypothetical protein KDB90_04580 [Planctomycetes bacterium]|nr:hypothetical protein [Planctomycetota bacterium]
MTTQPPCPACGSNAFVVALSAGQFRCDVCESTFTGEAIETTVSAAPQVTVVPLNCPKCGADLDVPEGMQRVTCRYCNSRLQLVETGSVRSLTLLQAGLDRIEQHSQKAADGVAVLVQHNQGAHERWAAKMQKLTGQLQHHQSQRRKANLHMSLWIVVVIAAAVTALIFFLAAASEIDPKKSGTLSIIAAAAVLILIVAAVVGALIQSSVKSWDADIGQLKSEVDAWRHCEPV